MSTATTVATIALVVAVSLGVLLMGARSRLRRLEARIREMEHRVDDDEAAIAAAHGEARAASRTARRAARAAGVELEPARLPLEPVAGRVVRVLAFGAGARRALTRLAGSRRRAA
ncbi:MAG TPA: hypothetical protein VFW06_09320 [Acidimicrobiia bacterium]|nr:hypothetical protein [Acidimicrobiia bacterium]